MEPIPESGWWTVISDLLKSVDPILAAVIILSALVWKLFHKSDNDTIKLIALIAIIIGLITFGFQLTDSVKPFLLNFF